MSLLYPTHAKTRIQQQGLGVELVITTGTPLYDSSISCFNLMLKGTYQHSHQLRGLNKLLNKLGEEAHGRTTGYQKNVYGINKRSLSNHHFPPSLYPMTPRPTNALINTSTKS